MLKATLGTLTVGLDPIYYSRDNIIAADTINRIHDAQFKVTATVLGIAVGSIGTSAAAARFMALPPKVRQELLSFTTAASIEFATLVIGGEAPDKFKLIGRKLPDPWYIIKQATDPKRDKALIRKD